MTEGKPKSVSNCVCVLTTHGDYYYGDPRPLASAPYNEFVAWQEAQFKKRKRPKARR